MSQRALKAFTPKTYVPRTSDGRGDKPSQNLFEGKELPDRPNRVWARRYYLHADDPGLALPRRGHRPLLPPHRRLVARQPHMRLPWFSDALSQALHPRLPNAGLIFHSDRGSQYGSSQYRSLLTKAGALQSMSARANPYHNAWFEFFMDTLKTEMLQRGCFIDEHDARAGIIEAYYNTHRKHSSFHYHPRPNSRPISTP